MTDQVTGLHDTDCQPPLRIKATVDDRLLTKADRLFTGTVQGRVIELLQNARRAGARHVHIHIEDGWVTVHDDGRGVEDFQQLLTMGGQGWEDRIEVCEDPAGVGLFCLAPREVWIRSSGKVVRISGDGWRGAPVEVADDPDPVQGTVLRFEDGMWSHPLVEPLAVFAGMKVSVDGQPCARESFVAEHAAHHPELGCRIEVREWDQLSQWHRAPDRYPHDGDVLVNFHGQLVGFDFHPVAEGGLHFLVDLTGEPTDIRLMLPARTRLVENEAFARLREALELEAYRYLQRRGRHKLPYKQYLRARELGIELPEATPTYEVGLLSSCDPPEPVDVEMPEDVSLAKCYRFDPDFPGDETDETNIHLLAALGAFPKPFVPVCIRREYDGYSWAKLPTIGKVELQVGKQLHRAPLWSGTLTCVDRLLITAHTSDGNVFSSPVCVAKAPPPESAPKWADDHVLVTPQAQECVAAEQLWYHLGGWYDEGDTYETQLADFERELERFWADLVGPDEQLRRNILEALERVRPAWKSVEVFAGGRVRVHFEDGSVKTIDPPRRGP